MNTDVFDLELIEMRQMYLAVEKQFLEFNEIIPYQYHEDWKQVMSPRLASLMLSVCPQVEKMLKILTRKMNLQPESKSPKFYDYITVLDSEKLLSNQTVGLPHPGYANFLFNPFDKQNENTLEWWSGYNKIKHELPEGIFYGTLHNTIYSLSALSVLHHIGYMIKGWYEKDYSEILNSEKWFFNEDEGVKAQLWDEKLAPNELPVLWSSKIFFFPTRRYQLA